MPFSMWLQGETTLLSSFRSVIKVGDCREGIALHNRTDLFVCSLTRNTNN